MFYSYNKEGRNFFYQNPARMALRWVELFTDTRSIISSFLQPQAQ